ncbi:hypothetical protein ASB62_06365 [Chlorobium limicola]|uniref:Uncharacterized protein n=1 Tax=Chlorobium limicola TaxID=1092 RepID=A0A117MN77_CHLLI|nr:hypothetical protein ASB62_06365 [Chlorobium limicola]
MNQEQKIMVINQYRFSQTSTLMAGADRFFVMIAEQLAQYYMILGRYILLIIDRYRPCLGLFRITSGYL